MSLPEKLSMYEDNSGPEVLYFVGIDLAPAGENGWTGTILFVVPDKEIAEEVIARWNKANEEKP